jgi:KaiC/GvpD/RAD55 family RecA-like ATPase
LTPQLTGIIRGIHSDWAYKNKEASVDGIVDFKLDESGEVPRNLIRIRSMRNVGFDGRWHQLRVNDENFEVTLEK